MQIMNTHLKTVPGQFIPEFLRHSVFTFGDEVETRTKAQARLKFHQLPAFIHPALPLHVMREHQGKFLAVRPARPTLWWTLRSGQNRPNLPNPLAFAPSKPAPHLHPDLTGNQRFDLII